MPASDLQTLFSSSGINDVANLGAPILTSANNTVNTAVEKVMDDFTQSQQQGTVSSFLNTGYQQLFTAMGIDPNAVNVLNPDNNPVINAGVAGASNVFMNIVNEKLSRSNFGPLKSLNNLQRLIQNPTVTIYENLPSSLTKMTWFVIAMETLLRKNNLPRVNTFGRDNQSALVTTRSYAQDIANHIHSPKFKFLFLMNVRFKGDFNAVFNKQFTFLIKKADRPKIKIEHEEINMYNFRTRFPKMVSYEPITIELHDSMDKLTLMFFLTYMKILSPVMRSRIWGSQTAEGVIDSAGMNFDAGYFLNSSQEPDASNPWAGSLNTPGLFSPVLESPKEQLNIIEEITIYHVYDVGQQTDIYHYINPRIMDFNLDDLDMSNGTTTNSLSFNFMYDALNIEIGRNTIDSDVKLGLDASVPETVKRMNFQGASTITPTYGAAGTVINSTILPSYQTQAAINASLPKNPPLPVPPTATPELVATPESVVPPIQDISTATFVDTELDQLNSSQTKYSFHRDPITGELDRWQVEDTYIKGRGNSLKVLIPSGQDPLTTPDRYEND